MGYAQRQEDELRSQQAAMRYQQEEFDSLKESGLDPGQRRQVAQRRANERAQQEQAQADQQRAMEQEQAQRQEADRQSEQRDIESTEYISQVDRIRANEAISDDEKEDLIGQIAAPEHIAPQEPALAPIPQQQMPAQPIQAQPVAQQGALPTSMPTWGDVRARLTETRPQAPRGGGWGAVQRQAMQRLGQARESQIAAGEPAAQYMAGAEGRVQDQMQQRQDLEAERQREQAVQTHQLAQTQKRQNTVVEREMGKLQEIEQELDQHKVKTWGDQDLSTRLSYGLAAALSSLGGAIATGDVSGGTHLLTGMMDRFASEQRDKLSQLKDKRGRKRTYLDDIKEKFADENQQSAVINNAILSEVDSQLDALAQKTNDESRLQAIAQGKTLVAERRANAQAQFAQGANDIAMNVAAQRARQASEHAALQAKQVQSARGMEAMKVPGMSFTGEKIPTKEDVKQATKGRAAVMQLVGMVDRMKNHANEFGTEYGAKVGVESRAYKVGADMQKELQIALKQAWEMGALAEFEYKILKEAVPHPNELFTGDVVAKLDNMRQSAISQWGSKARQYGLVDNELSSGPTPGAIAR